MQVDSFISFVRELYQQPTEFIPLHPPTFKGNEKKYLNECIDTTFVSSVGKFVTQFEEMVASFTGAKYAVATSNGTAALHVALKLAGVTKETEVITQPLTFIATANAINYCGAYPVFLDVDKTTFGLSAEALRKFLDNKVRQETQNGEIVTINSETGRRISAIVPMHTFGFPCDIEEIISIANQYNIPVVEDAAESLGSYLGDKHTGTFGLLGTLSFNGNKTITTGGGGLILTDSKEIAVRAKHITTTAKVPHAYEYVHDEIGFNYRLTNLAAALGVAQMEQLPAILLAKRELAEQYKKFFQENNTTFLWERPGTTANYWLNAIMIAPEDKLNFLEISNNAGVMTRPVWQLMNRMSMFKDSQVEEIPNALYLEERLANIPSGVI